MRKYLTRMTRASFKKKSRITFYSVDFSIHLYFAVNELQLKIFVCEKKLYLQPKTFDIKIKYLTKHLKLYVVFS